MVKTFYAPKEVCPPSQRESKRPAAESQNVKQQHTSSGVCFDFQKGECRRGSKCKFTHDGPDNTLGPSRSRREEVSTLMGEVKGLSSTTLIGMAKKKNKEDVLTKLGVRAVKNQTMPLKMALGIRDGRLKRQDKIVKEAKQSGVVEGSSMLAQQALMDHKEKMRGSRSERSRSKEDWHVGAKDGVFHLKRDRLDSRLLKSSAGGGGGGGGKRQKR